MSLEESAAVQALSTHALACLTVADNSDIGDGLDFCLIAEANVKQAANIVQAHRQ